MAAVCFESPEELVQCSRHCKVRCHSGILGLYNAGVGCMCGFGDAIFSTSCAVTNQTQLPWSMDPGIVTGIERGILTVSIRIASNMSSTHGPWEVCEPFPCQVAAGARAGSQ